MDIERSIAVCEAAQPGPWRYDPAGAIVFGATDDTYIADIRGWGLCERLYGTTKAMAMLDANGQFIADARENFPEALRRLKRIAEIIGNSSFAGMCEVSADGEESDAAYSQCIIDEDVDELHSLLSLDGKDGA